MKPWSVKMDPSVNYGTNDKPLSLFVGSGQVLEVAILSAKLLQVPFLNVETSNNRKRMSKVMTRIERVGLMQNSRHRLGGMTRDEYMEFNSTKQDESPDACLIRGYLRGPKSLHVRRTLDQSHYSMLPSTEERDIDQVLLKRGKRTRDRGSMLKVVMVDQLWLWIFKGMSSVSSSIHLYR